MYSTNVGQPKFRHPMKVCNVKLMDESSPTDRMKADSVSGILPGGALTSQVIDDNK